jgi:hypothetical protein
LRLLFIKEFPQTFLTAEIIISSLHFFSNGSSLCDIGLAIGILNKFFGLKPPIQFFALREYVFNKVAKDRREKEKKEDK